ncbi:energy transducer TonB [Stutzerimonas stutzeri]|uniref:Protein TonB n=1 Tax=Stutzerimonas stutzeri (strain A1501) TaxID=379731 RepID=A4VKX1_STUS1|nr:energy transducer TonB [Stutzerimonas stutzeri]ABP79622.1 TonB protein, C-terminal domain [Stutzerimonas stutzeri A1501]MBS9723195.1 energy transducer TonB [Stutzerimonas stutzeri]MDI9735443.1 energy transducer TonB [Stutzerimonas stutzeri]RRV63859.1 energy transducer TonB [Stutzerimonas stutzeri]RRW24402.1 energy transducer TonB [Stutzerimonas stutzeri]
MALGLSAPPAPVLTQRRWTGAAGAALTTLGLHAGLFVLLLTSWTPTMDAPVATQVMQTQLISLPPPVPVLPEPPVAKPVEAPPPPVQVEAPPQVEQAELAFKRAEREREAEQQRKQQLERRRQEQRRRDEQQRRERERLAEQARLDAQRRQAEAEAAARAEAAERARQAAAAEAASRQYLPIAKKPPVYPQRALDSGLQGACTVSYTVDVQGRVRSPKVVGDCHPLFIRPSLIAAQSFRYQPRIVDGRAVEVPNVQNTFHYRIE